MCAALEGSRNSPCVHVCVCVYVPTLGKSEGVIREYAQLFSRLFWHGRLFWNFWKLPTVPKCDT